jgi:hypothetical protein
VPCFGGWVTLRTNRKNGTRREARLSLAYLILVSLAFVALSFCSAFLQIPKNQTEPAGRWNASTSTPLVAAQVNLSATEKGPLGRRRLFPYSVIPRGVQSNRELRNAMAKDPVVAAHYAGFKVARTHIVRLGHDRAAYVSYRLGNVVFWTKRRVIIPAGESLLTDGESMARTRCGNRLSVSPEAPVSPEEPSAMILEALQEDSTLVAYNSPFELPLTPPPAAQKPVPVEGGPLFIPSSIWFPVEAARATHPRVTASRTPPILVPEPDTFLLLSTGFSALWLARKRRRS